MQTDENEETRGNDLEPVSEILSRRQEREAGRFSATTNQRPLRQETRVEECLCKTCGNKFQGEVTTFLFMRPPKEVRPSECPACRALREAEEKAEEEGELETLCAALRKQWIKNCGIPPQFQGMAWEDLDPDYQGKAQKLCRQWAERFDFDAPGDSSLVLFSPGPGVGKTLLCSLVGTQVINSWKGNPEGARCPVKFETGPRLVQRIRATFNLPEDDQRHEREEDVYRELRGVKLLILDDVGKEQPRSYRFTQELYWYLIDERVKAQLPVVINSRLPLAGEGSLEVLMGKDTVDRLYGMCRGKVISLKGESYRKLKKIP